MTETVKDKRYKVMFYLTPETHQADSYVKSLMGMTPHGERARLQRAALLAGLAMHRIDPRIPFLLAELLTATSDAREILQVISAALPEGTFGAVITGAADVPAPREEAAPRDDNAAAETRANAKGMFGKSG